MKRAVWIWELCGFAVTSLLGTLLHFLYDFTESAVFAAFSGVNESTWEHMKLMFWPMFIYAVFQSFFFKDYESFWCSKLRGTILGLILIPIFFYTYNGVIGKSPDWVNIAIFFISAAIAYIYEWQRIKNNLHCKNPKVAIFIFLIIGALFVIFTFNTPKIAIFMDPITQTYGI